MSITTLDYIAKLKKVKTRPIIRDVIKKNKAQIIDINKIALDRGYNYKDQIVGVYTTATELISGEPNNIPREPKTAGSPFNFDWTGRFIDGIFITYTRDMIIFDSRGKGGGTKLEFVDNNYLLGVSDNGADIINFEIILPQYQKEVKKILNG